MIDQDIDWDEELIKLRKDKDEVLMTGYMTGLPFEELGPMFKTEYDRAIVAIEERDSMTLIVAKLRLDAMYRTLNLALRAFPGWKSNETKGGEADIN